MNKFKTVIFCVLLLISFVKSGYAISTPALSTPTNGSTNSTTPYFSWGSVLTATSYRIMISDNMVILPATDTTTCSGCIINQVTAGGANSFTPSSGVLQGGKTYYWQIRAANDVGERSTWSSPKGWFYTAAATVTPTAPSLTSPTGGQVITTITPQLVWSGGSNFNSLQINLSKSPFGSSNLIYTSSWLSSGTTSALPTGLVEGTDYRWDVTACSGASGTGTCVTSGNATFSTQAATVTPTAPTLSSPTGGQVITTLAPQLIWSGGSNFNSLQINLSKSPFGSSNLIYTSSWLSSGTTSALPTGLVEGTNYRWDVTACSGASGTGTCVTSSNATFSTQAAAGPSTLVGPVPGLSLIWPVPSNTAAAIHPLQAYAQFNDGSANRHHSGVDIPATTGTSVVAAAAGTARVITLVAKGNQTHCMGNVVIIDHGSASTLYAHLQDGSITITNGQTVSQGQQIAGVGNTLGNSASGASCGSTGAHLHFELKNEPFLGTNSDDSTTWGYTPAPGLSGQPIAIDHPDQFGFHDPILNMHAGLANVAINAVTVTQAGAGAGMRVGPDVDYRSIGSVLSQGQVFNAIREFNQASTNCSVGWFQITNQSGEYFPDTFNSSSADSTPSTPAYTSSVPAVWVCKGNNGLSWVTYSSVSGDNTPPTAPTGLTASATSSSGINLSWNVSSDSGGSGLAGYKVERCSGSGCTSFVQIGTATSTSYTNTGLSASTAYTYRVRSYDNAANHSGYSNTAVAIPQTTTVLAINRVSPEAMQPSTSNQPFKVFGTNIQTGAHLLFTDPNGTQYNSSAHPDREGPISATEFDYQFNNGSMVGTWSVKVINPDGQNSNIVYFNVSTNTTTVSCVMYNTYFEEASQTYHVPLNLLKAIALSESGCAQYATNPNDGGCGIMQLTGNTKTTAANLISVAESVLCENNNDSARLNILGGAAVLNSYKCWASPRVFTSADLASCSNDIAPPALTIEEKQKLTETLEVWWWPTARYNGGGKDGLINTTNYPFRVWNKFSELSLPNMSYPPDIQYYLNGQTAIDSKQVQFDLHEISASDDMLYPRPSDLGSQYTGGIRWTDPNFNAFTEIILHRNDGSILSTSTPDTTLPVITGFTIPAASTSLTIPVTLSANDNVSITGYLLSESASQPQPNNSAWKAILPTSYTFTSQGTITLYAFAKDAAGNISVPLSQSVTISLPDNIAPVVTGFTIPSTSSSLTVAVPTLTASDNVAVTTYLLSESANQPQASNSAWKAILPTSYTFTSQGTITLYAFAKDAAGNISIPLSQSVTISLSDTIAPVVTGFTIPSTSTSLTVPIPTLNASDNVGVSTYLLSESASLPQVTNQTWTANVPLTYTFTTQGTKIVYAFAKDSAGNISAPLSAGVTITLSDITAPTVTGFSLPAAFSNLTVPVYTFTATDNADVTGFLLKESATAPAITDIHWTTTPTNSYTFSTAGAKILYAFARDASGNVSAPASASVTIALSDTTAPTVNVFSVQVTATSLTVAVTTFTATDNVAVTGYILSEYATAPQISSSGWTSTLPTSYSFSTAGSKTLYAYVKDAAGNISTSAQATVTVTLADTSAPIVTAFALPTTATGLTVPVTTFTANDDVAVTGYLLTELASTPQVSDHGWASTPPGSYTFSTFGNRTLYAYAKDSAGNSSQPSTASIIIVDTTAPMISLFTLPTASAILTVPVSTLTGSDNVGITNWCLTETNSASSCIWSATKPTSHAFTGGSGQRTLYAFAKDAADNVSTAVSTGINLILGDSNGGAGQNNGMPTIADAVDALMFTFGAKTPTAAELARADIAPIINGVPQPDGRVDIHDVIVILRRVVGLPL